MSSGNEDRERMGQEIAAPARPPRWKGYVRTILFMLAVTLVFISGLTAVYLATRDKVAVSQRLFLMRAVLAAAGVEVPQDGAEVARLFETRAAEHQSPSGQTYYTVQAPGGGVQSYVIMATGAGLWGQIVAAVGVSSDLQTMTGIQFLSQQETPGLGARISEKWFQDQFRGKEGPFRIVPEEAPAGRQEFQAITGATITSTAVLKIVNSTLENAPEIVQQGK